MNPNATAYTRLARQTSWTSCHGNCNQGRACTCRPDRCDMGTTLAAEEAMDRDEEAATFAAHMRAWRPALIVAAACAVAVLSGAALALMTH